MDLQEVHQTFKEIHNDTNKYHQKRYYRINNIDETEYSKVVWERKEKLEKYELLKVEGCLNETIFQVLNASKATLFRWKKQYKLYGLKGLENLSKRPHNVRKPTWTKEIEQKIYNLRKNTHYGVKKKSLLCISGRMV